MVSGSLLAEAKVKNDEGTLSQTEYAEYGRKFRALTNLLGVNERSMQIAKEFEASRTAMATWAASKDSGMP